MKQYKIGVFFEKGYLVSSQINLVTEDYKSTEFIFEFDIEEGRKVFELKKPDGSKYIKDIINNKITLVDYDTELNEISLIPIAGTYEFEIVNYTEDSKLTLQEHGHFEVRGEIVEVNDSEVEKDTRLPILDSLINDVEGLKTDINSSVENATEQANYAKQQGDYAKEQAQIIIDANTTATKIINDFETNVDEYTKDFNTNAESKENSYNENASNKLKEYNDNATTKLSEYNSNSETKTKAFDTNASEKTDAFNLNVTNKTTDFNSNTEAKTTEFNDNATTKTEEYNTNAEAKVNEFNTNVDELKQDVEDCYNNMLTNEVEGTSIHVEDSENARILALESEGNCEQANTKGNQLLNTNEITINEDNNYHSMISDKVLPSTEYTFSQNVVANIFIYEYDSENKQIIYTPVYGKNKYTFTTNENTVSLKIMYDFNQNTDKVMLNLGTEALVYEPYTGGQPSPNPDYPQDVEVVEAYNLFDKSNMNVLNVAIDTGTGKLNASANAKSLYLEIPNTKNITVSRISGKRFAVGTTDTIPSAGSTCLNYVGNNEAKSITIPVLPESKFLVVFYYNSSVDVLTEQEILDSIQIIKGTEVKPYVPYGCIRNKFTGKNLFNKGLIKFYANNFSSFENTSNVNNVRIRTSSFNLKDIGLKHNVFYEISGFPNGWILAGIRTYIGTIYLEDTSTYSLIGNKFSILSDKVDHIHLLFKNDNSTEMAVSDFENSDIQLEKGVATDYEPYQENILDINLQGNFKGKIGDVKDTLRVENGRAILTKRIGKVILDGSESWKLNIDNTEFKRYAIDNLLNPKILIKNDKILVASDYFQGISSKSSDNGELGISQRNNAGLMISIDICYGITTLEEFKIWLSENPVTVYYVLATPYEVDLGPVKMPKTFEGVTNVSLISNLESNMKLKYVRSTNIVVDNLAKAIVAMGGEV